MKVHICLILIINLSLILAGTVDFKLFEFDSNPKDVVWCGKNRESVIVITEKSSLYRSEDKGFSWKKLNDILMNKGKDQLEEDDKEVGKVSEMITSPIDKSLVIFLGTHGINWISENCGQAIAALNHGRKIQEFIFHPTERTWVLASAMTLCEDFQNEPCKRYKEVFLTKDLGVTWDLLESYVVQFNWGLTGENHIKSGIPKERILVTHDPRGKGDQTEVGWNYKVDLIYSDDFFKTKRIASQKGNKFLLTDTYLFVAQVVDQSKQEVMLLVADSNKNHYHFTPMEINNGKFMEHSYTFIDTTEGNVFLHVNHFGDHSKYGNVYTSDAKGLKYNLSLPHNVRSLQAQCDFERINGLEGIFIANVYDSEFMKEVEAEIAKEEMADTMENKKENKSEESLRNHITTVITFNKGGSWERIKAPNRDIEGKLYECNGECYLNLHGVTGEFPPYYSVESSVGLVIANGNVGNYLSFNSDEISTFLSRDGGLTWFEVRKGSHTYEFGDHGGIIVLADDQHPTDTILYSWDEGLQWQELRVSDDKISIKNIIVDPTSVSLNFVLYGESHNKKGTKKGNIVALNFSTMNEKRCKGYEEPDTPESDYEKWTPSRSDAKGCLLGRKVVYIRRKREVECFNGVEFERKNIVENCECSNDDYECDEGYYRPNLNDDCTLVNQNSDNFEGEMHKAPEKCSGYFQISKGYRKIPGNSCVNGVKYDPIIVPCPNSFFSTLGVIFFIILLLLAVGFIVYSFSNSSSTPVPKADVGSKTKQYDLINSSNNHEDEEDSNVLFDLDKKSDN